MFFLTEAAHWTPLVVNQCYLCLDHVLTSSILLFEGTALRVQCTKALHVQCTNKMYKKNPHTLVWVKFKSYATIPLSISFPGHGRGSLWPPSLKTLKYQKCTSLIASH